MVEHVFPISGRSRKNSRRRRRPQVTVRISGTGAAFRSSARGSATSPRHRPSRRRDRGVQGGIAFSELPIAYDGWSSGESEKHLGRSPHRRRAEEDLVARGTGKILKWSQVRAGWPTASCTCLAQESIRHLRLLHRSLNGKRAPVVATSPRARMTTSWCRAWPPTSWPGLFRIAYYEQMRPAQAGPSTMAGRQRQGPSGPSKRENALINLRGPCSSTSRTRAPQAGQSFIEDTSPRVGPREEVGYVPRTDEATSWPGRTSTSAARHDLRRRRSQVGIRSNSCWRASARSSRQPDS